MTKTKQIINNLIHNPNKENRDKFLKELDSKIDKRIFKEIKLQSSKVIPNINSIKQDISTIDIMNQLNLSLYTNTYNLDNILDINNDYLFFTFDTFYLEACKFNVLFKLSIALDILIYIDDTLENNIIKSIKYIFKIDIHNPKLHTINSDSGYEISKLINKYSKLSDRLNKKYKEIN